MKRKKFVLPQRRVEPQSFEQVPAHNLNFEGDYINRAQGSYKYQFKECVSWSLGHQFLRPLILRLLVLVCAPAVLRSRNLQDSTTSGCTCTRRYKILTHPLPTLIRITIKKKFPLYWKKKSSSDHTVWPQPIWKKIKDFMTNTTAASKQIPRRPRISINWKSPFQTSLNKISKIFFLD